MNLFATCVISITLQLIWARARAKKEADRATVTEQDDNICDIDNAIFTKTSDRLFASDIHDSLLNINV